MSITLVAVLAGGGVLGAILGLTRTPAMERLGVNFDGPMGAADPADVADEVRHRGERLPLEEQRLLEGDGQVEHGRDLAAREVALRRERVGDRLDVVATGRAG